MAIEFNCPHCGAFYRLDEKFAGKMGKCKNAKCKQAILIPFQSTATSNKPVAPKKIDAESLAAAAFSEEAAPPPEVKEAAPTKKMAVTCNFCESKFEVDAAMQGKNTTCPECRKIIRVPKLVEDKPSDWRSATGGRPSLAKSEEPVPTGAWDAQRKGVSGESLRQAGALEVEDEDERRERRLRNLKRGCYALALLGMMALGARYVWKGRIESRQEQLMERAVKEIEDKNDGSKKPEFQAAINRFAGEYAIRLAKKREDVPPALEYFSKARDKLQNMPSDDPDRNAMLVELGLSLVACGGDAKQISDESRLNWDQVHPLIRKCFDKIPPTETVLRNRAMRLLARKLAEKDQDRLAETVARNCSSEVEQPEMIGRVGIELFLMGKKELAVQALAKLPKGAQPASTALWLALNPEKNEPPITVPHVAPPDPKAPKGVARESRLAYAEGYALQGKMSEALKVAEKLPGPVPDRIEALCRIAAVALDTGKPEDANSAVEFIAGLLKGADPKAPTAGSWLYARAVELAARANKMEAAQTILDVMKDDAVKSWAKLEILRIKLAGQRKEKADETWVENVPDPAQANLAQALQREEVARHNAAAGESSYTRTVEALPKGTLRPFGYAGTALGAQDRK